MKYKGDKKFTPSLFLADLFKEIVQRDNWEESHVILFYLSQSSNLPPLLIAFCQQPFRDGKFLVIHLKEINTVLGSPILNSLSAVGEEGCFSFHANADHLVIGLKCVLLEQCWYFICVALSRFKPVLWHSDIKRISRNKNGMKLQTENQNHQRVYYFLILMPSFHLHEHRLQLLEVHENHFSRCDFGIKNISSSEETRHLY